MGVSENNPEARDPEAEARLKRAIEYFRSVEARRYLHQRLPNDEGFFDFEKAREHLKNGYTKRVVGILVGDNPPA